MKKVIKLSLSLFFAALISACGNSQLGRSEHAHSQEADSNTTEASAPSAPVSLKDDNLNAVYQHYIHLSTALTNANAGEAKIASAAIEAGAKNIEGGATIAASAAKISAADDLKAQRTEFSTLSNEFIALVKKSGLNSGELYVDYCPMALNDEGAYWVSNKKEIRNPYFGDEMLECGSVKETIK